MYSHDSPLKSFYTSDLRLLIDHHPHHHRRSAQYKLKVPRDNKSEHSSKESCARSMKRLQLRNLYIPSVILPVSLEKKRKIANGIIALNDLPIRIKPAHSLPKNEEKKTDCKRCMLCPENFIRISLRSSWQLL